MKGHSSMEGRIFGFRFHFSLLESYGLIKLTKIYDSQPNLLVTHQIGIAELGHLINQLDFVL